MNLREAGASTRLLIVVTSAVVLFFELALIRWLPANVYSLAYFSNLVLIATFYGFGLGFLCKKVSFPLLDLWPLWCCALVGIILGLREFNILVPAESIEWMWGQFQGDQLTRPAFFIPLVPALVGLFFLVALFFLPFGHYLARLSTRVAPLDFYHFDLLGSLSGIVLFSLLSAAFAPPVLWFSLGCLAASFLLAAEHPRRIALFVLPLLAATGLVWHSGRQEQWSPYYSILTRPSSPGGDFNVYVNRFYHQEAVDFGRRSIWGYDLPYRFAGAGDVLVVGAGTGNDVAVALKQGATSVDAVEIDPVIRRLGDRHPLRPYRDPRVRTIIQDARTFLQTTGRKYDLIVFGTLDSHALLSSVSTVRLDNYVYTLQSLQAAKRCLKPDGTLAMLYSIPTDWIFQRLKNMAVEVFGPGRVLCFTSRSDFLNFVVVASNNARYGDEFARFRVDAVAADVISPTDDWPFLYIRRRAVPAYLLQVITWILLLGSLPILLLLPRGRKTPHVVFLLLGVGFLLLETVTIVRMSVLFGSTWVVNAIVFFSILLMVLLANLVARRWPASRTHHLFVGLLLALAINYFVTPQLFLAYPFPAKALLAGIVAALPIFFSGMVFSQLFGRERDAPYAFGSNLLGALVGGFVEYLGMVTGFNALILLIMGVYLVVYLASPLGLRGR